jgi:D-alanyl-D-alanine carboxypeptidase (penicillin-binding protein 5/6)
LFTHRQSILKNLRRLMNLDFATKTKTKKWLRVVVMTLALISLPTFLAGAKLFVPPVNQDVTGAYVHNLLAGSALDLQKAAPAVTATDSNTATGNVSGGQTTVTGGIHSGSVLVMARHSRQILAEKNAQISVYPASLTKIMTAVIATDKLPDLDARVTVPGDFFKFLEQSHASVAGFKPGESVSVRDLLYGVLLPSGADASLTLARQTSGSEEAFVDLMNAKALALGMTGTHFMNPTGLHHPLQYTTAADMAKLLDYALNRPVLRQMLTTKYYRTTATPEHPRGLFLKERLFFLLREQARLRAAAAQNSPAKNGTDVQLATYTPPAPPLLPQTYSFTGLGSGELSPTAHILGGKTGATSDAGLCLASFANIHGREYILVTTAAMGNIYVDRFHVTDALNIYGQLDRLLGKA